MAEETTPAADFEQETCVECGVKTNLWVRGWDGQYRCTKHAPNGPRPPEKAGCGHPCKCHAINPVHDCEQPRTSIVMEWYEEDALKRIFRECGPDAAVEMVNRLLTATASHQYAKGIETGELWERTGPRKSPELDD